MIPKPFPETPVRRNVGDSAKVCIEGFDTKPDAILFLKHIDLPAAKSRRVKSPSILAMLVKPSQWLFCGKRPAGA
jgi:hypothetical protein